MFKRLAAMLGLSKAPPAEMETTVSEPGSAHPPVPSPRAAPAAGSRAERVREEAAAQDKLVSQILSEALRKEASEVRIEDGKVRYRVGRVLVDGPAVSGAQRIALPGLLRASADGHGRIAAAAGDKRADYSLTEPLVLVRSAKAADLGALKRRAGQIAELQVHAHGVAAPLPLEMVEMLIAALVDDLRRAGAPAAEIERMESVLRDLGKVHAAPAMDAAEHQRLRRQAEAALRGFARRA